MTTLIRTGSALALAAVVAACGTTEVRYVSECLERPERPVLPALSAEDAHHIEQSVWEVIVERDRLRRQYAEELEVIIDSTCS